ncbi:restriction endonuclease subunit S [Flavobacterium filum]|uniref:restriction endonuclease subunit S n=1 Tax=Flavobacterium filum TaxID=370974 RepID=UPI0023F03B43|nr:restriction endonuclease subunit S [Flavobacterium filum]
MNSKRKNKISECCDILDNLRVPINDEIRQTMQGNIPYYGANGIQGYIDKYIFDEDLILLAEDGGNFEEYHTRPIAYKISGKSWVNNHAHILRAKPEFNQDFIFYSLVHKDITKYLNSGTRSKLNKSELEKIEIDFPATKDEEDKIAKILSTADAVIEKTQAAIAKYKAIKQGMLQDLFTRGIDVNTNKLRPRYQDAPELYKESKLGMIPWEWDEKIFGEEVDLIHGHQFRDYDFTEFGIPVVKIGQVKPDNVDLSSCSFVAYGREDEFQNEIIRNGDVLMALTGATLGKACLVKGLNGIVLQNYRVGRFEPIIKQNDIDKEFLYYLLIAGDLLTQIFNKVNTGAQGNIGKADFEKATFKKPPFDEQQKIAERLKAIDNKLQTEQTYLQKMQSLKKGLMEDLLSGRKQVKINEATTV